MTTVAPVYARGAELSDDGLYRYWLGRKWEPTPPMTWVMLNPSTADADVDDPTIRRCMGFARRQGCGGIDVVNLYALRTTKPEHLLDHPEPEGPRNGPMVRSVMNLGGPVVVAWGSGVDQMAAFPPPAAMRVLAPHLGSLLCLGTTRAGHPRHPLYVPADEPLVPWDPPASIEWSD